jgi:hypothetical protein
MAYKATLLKKVNEQLVAFYPQTSADNVMYDSDTTIKEVVDQIILEIRDVEKSISYNSLYMTDSDGVTLLNDGSGNNLIAVGGVVAQSNT